MTHPQAQRLSAEMGWDHRSGKEVVRVWFGREEIVVLEPARKSEAGHGDDSSFFRDEEEAIVAETVAPYLRRIFAQGSSGRATP